ncbi:MAG TPA: hypothetical protein VGP69_01330 [Gaiellaceae bacterium]|nr:hypothetical protein [Gaiellaceae bacterium]
MGAVILTALLTLTVASQAGSSTTTGLRGHVTIGPLQPVCRPGTPCDGPARHVSLRFSRGGRSTQTRTDAIGNYRIVLPAGTYVVRPGTGFSVRPGTVLVVRGRMRVVNFAIDTGIR